MKIINTFTNETLFIMKKITIQLTFLLFVFISLVGYAQVNIGDGVEVNKRIPIEPFYGYTYSQVIYLQSEIETAMDIGHLIYNATPATTLEDSNQWTVYMGHTTKTQFDSDTDWINLAELTEVYSGTVTISSGAVHILLDTNFSYNGTDNLVIAVDENQSGYDSSTHDFYTTAVTNNRSISYWSDSTNPEPASPPTAGTVQAFIANITLDTTPTCSWVTDLDVNDIGSFSSTVTWTENGSASSWNLEYGEAGFELGTGTTAIADTTTFELTGLSSDTPYDVYVQADCDGDGLSSWTGPVTFQTLISCPSPTELSVSDITETSANLSWIENGTATTWNIEYGTSGFVLGEGTLESITDNPYTLSGLSDSTTYDYYVQADCGDGDSSSWTGPFTFQTSVVAGTCGIYTVELIDSFGDGWNGGMLDLYINGDLYQNVTLESGTGPEVTEVPVDIEDVLSIIYTSGSWASENEYKVYDQLGNLIFDEGASGEPNSIGDPTIPTGITACPTCPTPIELSVSEVGAYSVVLNWTEIGEATTWNIEYGPVGFTIGSGTALVADTNPFTLTDLVPNTNYDCYIQADCAGDDLSTWSSVITWLTLPIPPENNDCENASILPLDGTLLTATNFASSASGELPEPSCDGFGDGQDVWYVVTATELSNITISTEEFPGSELDDTVVSLYSGVCGDFEEIACNDDYLGSFSTVTAYGIEAGETIYIRVHEFNNDTFDTFYISATYVSAASVNDTLIDGFTMYPNPVGNILHIKANVSIDQVNISDMLGRNLIKSDTSALDMEINMNHLPIGTYLVEVTSGNNTETYKLIKE